MKKGVVIIKLDGSDNEVELYGHWTGADDFTVRYPQDSSHVVCCTRKECIDVVDMLTCEHYTLRADGTGDSGDIWEYVDGGDGKLVWRNRYHYKEALTVLLIGKHHRQDVGLWVKDVWTIIAKMVYE